MRKEKHTVVGDKGFFWFFFQKNPGDFIQFPGLYVCLDLKCTPRTKRKEEKWVLMIKYCFAHIKSNFK
jgi:hypothetical protein